MIQFRILKVFLVVLLLSAKGYGQMQTRFDPSSGFFLSPIGQRVALKTKFYFSAGRHSGYVKFVGTPGITTDPPGFSYDWGDGYRDVTVFVEDSVASCWDAPGINLSAIDSGDS